MATDTEKKKAEELKNSRLIDVHKWSEYPEVNKAVDAIYGEFLKFPEFKGMKTKQKKHIKVVVLDLYVRYLEDREGYISFYRMKAKYKGKSRYNQLHISYDITISVIDNLEKLGYLEQTKGHYDRTGKRPSHMSRMRAKDKLIDSIIKKHNISPTMIEKHPHTECIILRDKEEGKQQDILYTDTPDTISLREDCYTYNNLIRRSHIDVHSYPEEGVYSNSDEKVIKVDRNDKFIRRIYNNNLWTDGGRYYGGWWQRIPKGWREHIRIDGSPTVEIDYSGLHIILLYGKKGIDYWKDIGKDPYQIKGYEQSKEMRGLLKFLLLTMLNAESRGEVLKSIRKEINLEKKYPWLKEKGIDIGDLIDKFSDTHKPISEHFYKGHGIKLQNVDSNMAALVIKQLTKDEIPVLCIHDSFIIAKEHKDKLEKLMIDSFNALILKGVPKVTDNINPFDDGETYVPFKGLLGVGIREDYADEENSKLGIRLREHQSIEWSNDYYYIDTK